MLLIGEGEKKHYVLIDDLKCHIKDCFKINGKQTIKMPKKGEYVKFKNFKTKIRSPFMIYSKSKWVIH